MKNSKIVALVATAALLVLGAAFTSFAAQYNWYQQDGEWRCKNASGDDYYAAWAKSGSDYYWLDDEGWMAREALVDDDTKYVNADGKMVKNDWVKLTDDEGNDYWNYFQAGGKKLTGKADGPKPVTINGKKYIFNDEGKMLSGWVGKGYDDLTEDYEWQDGVYYCGDEDDGAVTLGWRQIECYNEAEDFVDNNYWFWFGTNGQKFAADKEKVSSDAETALRTKNINGKNYAFNQFGVMKAEWEAINATLATATNGTITNYAWFQSAEIGAKLANGWFREIPSANVDKDNNDDSTAKWFWAKSGKLAANTIKTINGKKYAFNDKGEMLVGLQKVSYDEESKEYTFEEVDEKNIAELDTPLFEEGYAIAYFSNDEDNDGSMKTGLQTVNIDGDDYSFYFSTKSGDKGYGIRGKQGNKYYYNGKKVAADDAQADYMFFKAIDWDTKGKITAVTPVAPKVMTPGEKVDAYEYALVSKTGVIATSGTKKDGNGSKAKFCKPDDEHQFGYWDITTD